MFPYLTFILNPILNVILFFSLTTVLINNHSHRWIHFLLSRYCMPDATFSAILISIFDFRLCPSERRKDRKSPPDSTKLNTLWSQWHFNSMNTAIFKTLLYLAPAPWLYRWAVSACRHRWASLCSDGHTVLESFRNTVGDLVTAWVCVSDWV